MKIGFNLLLWTTHLEERDFAILGTLKRAGYDGVEIPCFGGDIPHYRKIGAALRNEGLEATALTIIPDADRNPPAPIRRTGGRRSIISPGRSRRPA